MAEDYYQILGVSRSASTEEIQKAYRKLARKYHPDLYSDADAREQGRAKTQFQKVQRAYEVLNDPEKRRMYDQFGPDFEKVAGAGYGRSGGQPFGAGFDPSQFFGQGGAAGGMGGFEELLRNFQMGAGMDPRGRSAPRRGRDVRQKIKIPFHTAVMGGEYSVAVEGPGGAKKIAVKIPPGIESGKKIRLKGQGQNGHPAAGNGDLLIEVEVAPHPHFTRRGLNLHIVMPVSPVEAALGCKIDVPTPHGTITMTVPPGTKSGKLLRAKGMGVRAPQGDGDLLIELRIQNPDSISEADAAVLRKLSDDWTNGALRKGIEW